MSLGHRARRGPADRRGGRLARLMPAPAGCARDRSAAFAAGLSRRLRRAVGGAPGAAAARGLGAGADAAWSTRPCWRRPEGQALPDFEMQRETILSEAREIAHGEREAGLQPRIRRRSRRAFDRSRERALRRSAARVAILLALGAAAFALAPQRAAVPRAHRGRAMADGGARSPPR